MGFLDKLIAKVSRATSVGAAPRTTTSAPAAPRATSPAAPRATTPGQTAPRTTSAGQAAKPTAPSSGPPAVKTAAPPPAPPAAKPAARPTTSILGPSKAPPGPLKLSMGDFVTHYRERFIVAGVRRLEGSGSKIQHYCLRDASGAAAVLAVEDSADPVFTLQRLVPGDIRWDADSLDVADGRFGAPKRFEMKVRTWDDAGIAVGVRSMTLREFRDPSDERVLVLEDYDGRREVRVGEPVFEAELECERAGSGRRAGVHTAALGGAATFEDTIDDDIAKGSPRAAAKVLEQNVGNSKTSRRGLDEADENDPGTYVDEWSDAKDVVPETVSTRSKAAAKPSMEDSDEWVNATRLLRDSPEARRRTQT